MVRKKMTTLMVVVIAGIGATRAAEIDIFNFDLHDPHGQCKLKIEYFNGITTENDDVVPAIHKNLIFSIRKDNLVKNIFLTCPGQESVRCNSKPLEIKPYPPTEKTPGTLKMKLFLKSEKQECTLENEHDYIIK